MTSFHHVQYPRPWTEKRLLLNVLAQMGLALPADQMRSVRALTLALVGTAAQGRSEPPRFVRGPFSSDHAAIADPHCS
jgi:hypothetical protein